ncbi:hypothetical protein BVG16_10780 [Paenibacillus selenitireducens]|uniref:Transglutaminase-like domain-containing protein n=2 Tax=Paenibacillus selenitireducens TaxID=1324314 RepID=A0A1T2XEU3_9BACL|nr:hypothetical protein BVG16_10780 [Paenibacillus selenitireducens]
MVRLTLLGYTAIQLFIPLHVWIRRILIILLIGLIQFEVLGAYQLLTLRTVKWSDVILSWGASQYPYMLFTFGTWALFEIIRFLVRSRRRIIAFMTIQLIGLAILDSFTVLNLWKQVAWVVLAGLSWLIVDHFIRLRSKYPEGWRNLATYPLKLICTVGLLLLVIVVAGTSMPSTVPLIPDPYTMWKTWKGEAVPTFYSGEVSADTINARAYRSGYGRDDSTLGAGFDFDHTPVMEINTNHRSYWRGETRSYYTGEGWIESYSETLAQVQPVALDQPLKSFDLAPTVETTQLTATVTMRRNESYPVLFGAYSAQRLTQLDDAAKMGDISWKPESSSMLFTGKKDYPKTYTFVSEIPIIDEAKLRELKVERNRTSINRMNYIQLPKEFPARVKDLALSLTAGQQNDYDRIQALTTYLKSEKFTYTNEPDLSLKQSSDFVDSFLFELKQGYCDYFSTSLVTMARSIGIPARWVKGYVGGSKEGYRPDQYMPNAMMEEMAKEEGTYIVSNADAHSWAEIYFEGFGWIPFEATPGFTIPMAQEENQAAPVTVPDLDTTANTDETKESSFAFMKPSILTYSIMGIIFVIMLYVLFVRYRLHWNMLWRTLVHGHRPSSGQKLIVLTEHWLYYCRRKGLLREEHETLRESVSRWEKERSALAGAWNQLLPLFEKAKYSTKPVTDQDWSQAQSEMKKLMQRL